MAVAALDLLSLRLSCCCSSLKLLLLRGLVHLTALCAASGLHHLPLRVVGGLAVREEEALGAVAALEIATSRRRRQSGLSDRLTVTGLLGNLLYNRGGRLRLGSLLGLDHVVLSLALSVEHGEALLHLLLLQLLVTEVVEFGLQRVDLLLDCERRHL